MKIEFELYQYFENMISVELKWTAAVLKYQHECAFFFIIQLSIKPSNLFRNVASRIDQTYILILITLLPTKSSLNNYDLNFLVYRFNRFCNSSHELSHGSIAIKKKRIAWIECTITVSRVLITQLLGWNAQQNYPYLDMFEYSL